MRGFCRMAIYENATHVRTQVTAALLKLMETTSYQAISISELACAAEVSRSSVYRNFADKDDVLRQYLKNGGKTLRPRQGRIFLTVYSSTFMQTVIFIFCFIALAFPGCSTKILKMLVD